MTPRSIKTLLATFGLTFLAGAIGAWGSADAAGFYAALTRPSWAPPAWLFGPVWTILYLGIAWAGFRVASRSADRAVSVALGVWGVQLALNALWSVLFFHLHWGAEALWDISLLWVAIVATIVLFWRVDRWAGLLLIPYALWVSFALMLNYSVWQLNRGLLG